MKKQDKHPIDDFFKENINQDFPYDPALWNKADKGMAAFFNRKRLLYFSLLLLLFMSSVAVFFANTGNKPERISRKGNSTNTALNKKNGVTKASGYKNPSDDIAIHSSIENTATSSTAAVSNAENENPKTNKNVNEQGTNYEENETKDDIKKESNIVAVDKEEDLMEATTNEKQKIVYFYFVMMTKPFHAFPLSNATVENAIKCPGAMKESKKKGFATFIEFENLNSVILNYQLSRLSQKELNYKDKYEKPLNATGYVLSILMQRGGFGFTTGLGYSEALINTSYIVSTNTYVLGDRRYKMIKESVPYGNNKYYSHILEYRDTVGRNVENELLIGQSKQNIFQWIQVPLKFSYQKSLNRLRFSVRVGSDLMWLYKSKGTFINSNLDGLNAAEKFNRFNVNTSGQLMTGCQLNHKIQVGGSFYMNQQLGSNFVNYNSRFQSKGYGLYVRWGL